MTVQVRLPRGETRKRGARRQVRAEHHPLRADAAETTTGPEATIASREHEITEGSAPTARRRLGGPTQDTALYKCQCGFVFEAHVSTSVGCPHCGGTQAW